MQIMKMTGYVLFWYLLGVKLTWGHAHKTRSWYLLGVAFKKSDEHPCHFYMGVPPGQLTFLLLYNLSLKLTQNCCCIHFSPARPNQWLLLVYYYYVTEREGERETSEQQRGNVFSIKSKTTCKNSAHLDD